MILARIKLALALRRRRIAREIESERAKQAWERKRHRQFERDPLMREAGRC